MPLADDPGQPPPSDSDPLALKHLEGGVFHDLASGADGVLKWFSNDRWYLIGSDGKPLVEVKGGSTLKSQTGTAYTFSPAGIVIDARDMPAPSGGPAPSAPPGSQWVPDPGMSGTFNLVGPDGVIYDTRNAPGAGNQGPAAPIGPGPFGGAAQSGQLLPTEQPGIYQFVNPNTGAIEILDLSVPDAKLIAMIDPTTNAPVPGMFLDSSGKQVDLRPPNLRDPVGVANILISQYDSAIRAEGLSADKAWRDYQIQYNTANLQLTQWQTEEDIWKTQSDAALKKWQVGEDITQRRQETATSRGNIMSKMLSSSIPGLTGLKLPLIGRVPVTQFNPATYFDQFVPPGPPPVATVGPTPIAPPAAPPLPNFAPLPAINLPPPPDLSKLLGV